MIVVQVINVKKILSRLSFYTTKKKTHLMSNLINAMDRLSSLKFSLFYYFYQLIVFKRVLCQPEISLGGSGRAQMTDR